MFIKNQSKKQKSEYSYWQSYSDMMASLLLMFVLIMAFTLAQSLSTFEEKEHDLVEKQMELDEQRELHNIQEKVLQDQKDLLEMQQKQIDDLIGVKAEIIRALSEAFRESNLSVDIDAKTGAISLDSSILFGYDSAELSSAGIDFIEEFLPLYVNVLMSDSYMPYISEIIIEGHTDTIGSYMYNLNLSQKRAYSVAAYCLDEKTSVLSNEQLSLLREIMTANGKSYSNPVLEEDGKVNAEKSRRVEIKFRMQDEEMIANLKEILEGNTV